MADVDDLKRPHGSVDFAFLSKGDVDCEGGALWHCMGRPISQYASILKAFPESRAEPHVGAPGSAEARAGACLVRTSKKRAARA